jgi:Rho termination factor, N-terminal domain
MTKTELESKHLAELHALAAEANVPRYRMLRREELIEKLAGGSSAEKPSAEKPRERQESRRRSERKPRERREGSRRERSEPRARPARRERAERPAPESKSEPPAAASEPTYEKSPEAPATGERPGAKERRPRRRRRRFGRKRKELRLRDLATAGGPGRQTVVYAETRAACTALLRQLAAELASESNGSDPIALLIDPGPEELADWRREAPNAEIVVAAQARHAEDAIAQAARRAESGENVVVLLDSLTRLAELGDANAAVDLLDGARTVTVVAALEHP